MRKAGMMEGPGELIRDREGRAPGSYTHQCKHSGSQHGIHCVEPGYLWGRGKMSLGTVRGGGGAGRRAQAREWRMWDRPPQWGPLTAPNPPQQSLRSPRTKRVP